MILYYMYQDVHFRKAITQKKKSVSWRMFFVNATEAQMPKVEYFH